jgi:hypothetical protein
VRRIAALVALVVALGGCGGSATIRAGGPGPTGTVSTSGSGASVGVGVQGGSVHLGRGAAVVIVLGVAIGDGLSWAAKRLRHAMGGEPEPAGQSAASERCPQPCGK